MVDVKIADVNSITNDKAELDSTINEEELEQESNESEEEESTEETSDEGEEETEDEKPLKQRKSNVPKLLKEKNAQKQTIKVLTEENQSLKDEVERLKTEKAPQAQIDEAMLEQKLAERDLARELATEFPDIDSDEARSYAKKEGISLDKAYKLLAFDYDKKVQSSSSKKLTGGGNYSDTTSYTMADLEKMTPEQYNRAVAKIESWKAKLRR